MLMPTPTVQVRFSRSISWMWFIRLTSTRIPWRRGTAPSVNPVPPSRGTIGTPRSVARRTTAATSSVDSGSTTTSGTCSDHRCTGNGAGVLARLNRSAFDVSTWSLRRTPCSRLTRWSRSAAVRLIASRSCWFAAGRSGSDALLVRSDGGSGRARSLLASSSPSTDARSSPGARVAADVDPQRLGEQLVEVDDVDARRRARLGQRALGPRAGADERVDVERRRLLDAPGADRRGQLRLLDGQPAAGTRAVRPLGDAV